MKINNSTPLSKPHLAEGNSGKAAPGQQSVSANTKLTTVSLGSTGELEALVAQSADIRDSLVADIKLRLAAGEFASDQAVYETAESILNL